MKDIGCAICGILLAGSVLILLLLGGMLGRKGSEDEIRALKDELIQSQRSYIAVLEENARLKHNGEK